MPPPPRYRSGCRPVSATDNVTPAEAQGAHPGRRRRPGLLRLLTIRLRAENYEVEAVESAAAALAACVRFRPDLVITDLRMDHMDGIGLLKELQSRWPGLRVIILTAHGTIPDAVHATQSGAFGFLTKPVDKQELLDHVQKALKCRASRTSTRTGARTSSRAASSWRTSSRRPTWSRAPMRACCSPARAAPARSCWRAPSTRRARGATSRSSRQLQRDGRESARVRAVRPREGRVPGATRSQKGLFETADGGTLLLDESATCRCGCRSSCCACCRRIRSARWEAPSRRDQRARDFRDASRPASIDVGGQFREDLYYRLNVVHIEMPALGRRREDIPLLVAHFLEQIAKESGQRKIYAPEAVELLATAEWPGNVRQLYNVVRQNVALSHGADHHGRARAAVLGGNPTRLPSFDEARDEFTRNYLSQILQITTGNVSQAARLAKRNRTDFYKLLSRHQLLPDDFKKRREAPRARALGSAVELRDARDHVGELRFAQFRIDRQRQGLGGRALGLREVPGA
jgi:two-component system, NtrC family, response regulator GlrR